MSTTPPFNKSETSCQIACSTVGTQYVSLFGQGNPMEPRNLYSLNESSKNVSAGENPLRLASYEYGDPSGSRAGNNAHSEVSDTWHRQMHEHHASRSHYHHHVNHETHHSAHHSTSENNYPLGEESSKRYKIVDYTFRPVHPIQISFTQPSGLDRSFLASSEHSQAYGPEPRTGHHRWEQHSQVYSYGSRSHEHSSRHHHTTSAYSNYDNFHPVNFMAGNASSFDYRNDFSLTHTAAAAQRKIVHLANKMADAIHTTGNCALGPRLLFEDLGFTLPQVMATTQGAILEQHKDLFRKVSRSEVQPGDYGYRHWVPSVVKAHHNVDKGDAFFVTAVGHRGELYGANDHHFVVPNDGGRYKDTTFLRPTAEFYRIYGSKLDA